MPIGNLTSQIFANIYLNELDRFIKYQLKPKAYLRYGDDFILLEKDLKKLKLFRNKTLQFLENDLKLSINPKNDTMGKVKQGLEFLGVVIWPYTRILNQRNFARIEERLNGNNVSSYSGIIKEHTNGKHLKRFNWLLHTRISEADKPF